MRDRSYLIEISVVLIEHALEDVSNPWWCISLQNLLIKVTWTPLGQNDPNRGSLNPDPPHASSTLEFHFVELLLTPNRHRVDIHSSWVGTTLLTLLNGFLQNL